MEPSVMFPALRGTGEAIFSGMRWFVWGPLRSLIEKDDSSEDLQQLRAASAEPYAFAEYWDQPRASMRTSRLNMAQQAEAGWLARVSDYAGGATSSLMEAAAHTTAATQTPLEDISRLIQPDNFPWSNSLNDEERMEMMQDLGTAVVAAFYKPESWSHYHDTVDLWQLRAALARQYNAPLSAEQQAERAAWQTIQDDALDFIFTCGATT